MFAGEKRFFYSKDICLVTVPRCTAISVKYVLARIIERPEIMLYVPDLTSVNSKSVDRDFLFNVVNTVDPDFFKAEVERQEQAKRER